MFKASLVYTVNSNIARATEKPWLKKKMRREGKVVALTGISFNIKTDSKRTNIEPSLCHPTKPFNFLHRIFAYLSIYS